MGLALRVTDSKLENKRVGVVGLGTGTLAAYGKTDDYFRFYEINQDVINVAQSHFSYLEESKAEYDIILGDARLSLNNEQKQEFDVLVLDAFSSDAIPVHLLTQQAFEIYLKQLKPGGILAVHISNAYLDLRPVVWQAAQFFDLDYQYVGAAAEEDLAIAGTRWILLSPDKEAIQVEALLDEQVIETSAEKQIAMWTDDYSNIFRVIRWKK